jgi:type III secretory pathway component EscS
LPIEFPVELLGTALAAWLAAAILALTGPAAALARALLGLGGLALIALIAPSLPGGTAAIHTALGIGPAGSMCQLSPQALWLMAFGLAGAILAAWMGTRIAVHKPLANVPENTLKFAVGVLLSAFGMLWVGEGVGVSWSGGDAVLLALIAGFLVTAILLVPVARVQAKVA